ncbi:MAG TPA: hypothetical protein VF473_00305 [Cyclobacteriaceae bacterium]
MKILSFAIVFILLLGMSACKKADEIVDSFTHFGFETDYVLQVPVMQVTALPLEIVTPDIATHSDVLFSSNKTRADLVEEMKMTALTLSVKTPAGGDLKFLKSVDIYSRAQGLPDVRIAFKDVVPADVGAKLDLDVTGVELREYFSKDKYQLKIIVVTDQAVTQDYAVNAHAKFFVDAKLL